MVYKWPTSFQPMSGIYSISTSVDDTTFSMWTSTLVTTATLARNNTYIKCALTGRSTVDPENSTTILIAGERPEPQQLIQ